MRTGIQQLWSHIERLCLSQKVEKDSPMPPDALHITESYVSKVRKTGSMIAGPTNVVYNAITNDSLSFLHFKGLCIDPKSIIVRYMLSLSCCRILLVPDPNP
jgi:hypothetical protein